MAKDYPTPTGKIPEDFDNCTKDELLDSCILFQQVLDHKLRELRDLIQAWRRMQARASRRKIAYPELLIDDERAALELVSQGLFKN